MQGSARRCWSSGSKSSRIRKGVALLRDAGIEVETENMPEALELIESFQTRMVKKRPFVRIKTASSLDGAISMASGESKWITGEEARSDVQYWRARSDAIISGVGSVLHDNPRLTLRRPIMRVLSNLSE